MYKKITAAAAALTVVISGAALPAQTADIFGGESLTASAYIKGDFCYDVLSDGTAQIYGYVGTEKNVTIPEQIDGHTVTKINGGAFHDVTSMETLTISDTVTSIGDSAFRDCTSLKSVVISDSVTEIGDMAFQDCNALESVVLPKKIKEISDSLFCRCESLTSVNIPKGVTKIVDYAFYGCSSLENITIPYGVTYIGNGAFMGCTSMKSVFVPEDVTEIGKRAFGWYSDTTYNMNLPISGFVLTCTLGSAAVDYAKEYSVDYEIHTHSYKSAVAKKATCSAAGVRRYTCSCGKTYTKSIAKTAHKYVTSKVVAPTLKARGYTLKTCSVCKTRTKTNYKAKLISAEKFSISGVGAAYVYTGKAIAPTVTVKYGTTKLKKGTDYTVKYSSNKSTGKAKITVTGKGKYSGTKVKYFKILPKQQKVTGIRSPKAKAVKVAWKKDAQASGYEVTYSSRSDFKTKKTVTVSKKYTAKVLSGLTSGKTYYVKVRSYKAIDGKRAYGKYSAVKKVKCI